jgi:hypothetical protein
MTDQLETKKAFCMARQGHVFTIALGVASFFFGLALEGCSPARPRNVPLDAVHVRGGDSDWWERCSYNQADDIDHCQTFNAGGVTLEDEPYLPYDGDKAANESDLKIDANARLRGPYIICLQNGRILIPTSDFENQKRFLDFATGKSKSR